MTQNPTLLALGLAGGYLLGRTRKAKLALAVASYVLGRRAGVRPQHLLTEGLKKLSDTPEFARLGEQVRGDLMSAGRSMATAAANRRMDALSDALHDRTDALSGRSEESEEEPEEAEGPEEERAEEERREEERREEEPEKNEEEPAAGKGSPKKAPPKQASQKRSTAEKTTSRHTAAKKSTARRTAAKKTASRSTGRR